MYKITLRKRAVKEYLEAIIWYKERSVQAAENFVKSVNKAFAYIEVSPQNYRIIFSHFHEIQLQKYPYTIVYFIDNDKNSIVITAIFHYKRNPKKKFVK